MINDLIEAAGKYGLKLHLGKTVVLTNCTTNRPETISCRNGPARVAAHDKSERYLGRQITLPLCHATELSNRLAVGWAAFFKNKELLCNRKLSLKARLKFFEAVVTACVLYGCGAWALTDGLEVGLRMAERKMLR